MTDEKKSGALLMVAAVLGLAWANSPWRDAYADLSNVVIGPAALHLDLSVASWAADGLLAIFFFVVGVELKQEIVTGSLRNPRLAGVPVLAAVGGMLVPAGLYVVLVIVLGDQEAIHGWAVPTATDIAFAVAVLAMFGRGLPKALRLFLLTLAVVDDLLAIIVIAAFYTDELNLLYLAAAIALVAVFAGLVRMRKPQWWLLIPVAIVAWALMHASGVHATIAGVLLGLSIPARQRNDEDEPRTERYGDRVSPLSNAIALPAFAFFAAGVNLIDGAGLSGILSEPVFPAVAIALVVGKLIGVLGTTALVTRTTPLRLPDAIGLRDLLPIGFLTGIGFTVSLLITDLSYRDETHQSAATAAILGASVIAAILGAATLRWDARQARSRDMNEDGIPDIDIARIGEEEPG